MNSVVRVQLTPSPEQHARLVGLQAAFADVCNALAPVVRETRIWNRVALHHLTYKSMRERFPAIGSQMVCNAIYSVSRACRMLFQAPASPFNVAKRPGKPLPLLRFADNCPVYFDRHTLSLRDGQASMFTLDGRMRFQLALEPAQERAFHTGKLLEIVLSRPREGFELSFVFAASAAVQEPAVQAPEADPEGSVEVQPPRTDERASTGGELPEYLLIEEPI